MKIINKPQEGEYVAAALMYIRLLPDDGLVLKHLENNLKVTKDLILTLSEEQLVHRYAEGKWTIKEILSHVIDDERIYSYRALRFARNDKTELPGFEPEDYVTESGANRRNIKDILNEFSTVRRATISLFEGLGDEVLTRTGLTNGNVVSVRTAAYHIAGHEIHHINIIRERYL